MNSLKSLVFRSHLDVFNHDKLRSFSITFYTHFDFQPMNRSQSEDPALFNIPMPTQRNADFNQLGVVAGPFGQMLVNKEQLSSRRGSSFSLNSNVGAKDKL